jgi:hypothetical protein
VTAAAQLADCRLEDVEPLLLDQAAEEQEHRFLVGIALAPAPVQVALGRGPEIVVDAAAPDADMIAEPGLLPHAFRKHFVGSEHIVAAAVETREVALTHGADEAKAVIIEIGLEQGVEARHDRDVQLAAQLLSLVAEHLGR